MTDRQPTERFSDRVEDYLRYRPDYPRGVLDILQHDAGLCGPATIADIGSGTGLSARLFLEAGHTVFGVEPNAAMRSAGERCLALFPKFRSVDGTAEATTLPDASIDYVVAAQAFHWFEPAAARREFARILKPGGWCVLLWNTRRLNASPFLRGYEALLLEFGTDYQQVRHENIDAAEVARFFGGPIQRRELSHFQSFDLVGLKGRLASSSYAPQPGHPYYEPMISELERVFSTHAENGVVRFEYDTEIYLGRLTSGKSA